MLDNAYSAMQMLQEQHWWWRGMRHLYRAALQRYVPTQGRVLDVGCGFGANLPVFREAGFVIGMDVSFDALRAIPPRPQVALVVAEADALPFKAGSFDLVGLMAVAEHVEQHQKVLEESYRVAKPGAIQLL